MRDKAMPLGKKFKVRLTITPEETGTPVDMLGFTFTSGRKRAYGTGHRVQQHSQTG